MDFYLLFSELEENSHFSNRYADSKCWFNSHHLFFCIYQFVIHDLILFEICRMSSLLPQEG